jgi:hypothetical protein
MAMKARMISGTVMALVLSISMAKAGVVRQVLRVDAARENLLKEDAWKAWEQGFEREGALLVCRNGADAKVQRGASQGVTLDQTRPQPIIATAWSRAEGVTGGKNVDYSLYLDILYTDGTPQWGQISPFNTGTHDWEKRRVFFFPDKPIKHVSFYLLLRRHGGSAWFRDPELKELTVPEGGGTYDGVPVLPAVKTKLGLMVRDVVAGSDFVDAEGAAGLGLKTTLQTTSKDGAEFVDLTVTDTSGRDRAVVIYYRVATPAGAAEWLGGPPHRESAQPGREYAETVRFAVGTNGRLSRYPFGAVAGGGTGVALGFDPAFPAFGRVIYNHDERELFVACDVALAKEKPTATLRFVRFPFAPEWGFRAALSAYVRLFPEAFRSRTPKQGLWMPFAKISEVKGWQDFGFKFKEGNNETEWDDAHDIVTFRYTEPLTWWMRMPKDMPRTLANASSYAEAAAQDPKHHYHRKSQALLASGYHDEEGEMMALITDAPWCSGAVWSMNSMPGIKGDVTDFSQKWSPELREKLYGPKRKGDLDGEYVDSSEGYVTGQIDFRRDHFAAADRPLTFSLDGLKPGVFRGLIAFEYMRGIERDVHGMGKLMMANGTPSGLWWLAPLLDVMGTETDWNRGAKWQPMSHKALLFRRALCGPKPYCFLMNTKFDDFSHELVEKYMKRAVAYGMFPGFFSANAATGQYFQQPELYDRDRDLFQRYVPVCTRIAEAGWQPITQAKTSAKGVYLERFGDRYLTVFNDGKDTRDIPLTVQLVGKQAPRDLLGHACEVRAGKVVVRELAAEDVAVLDLGTVGK